MMVMKISESMTGTDDHNPGFTRLIWDTMGMRGSGVGGWGEGGQIS